jgi:hypothetical protein
MSDFLAWVTAYGNGITVTVLLMIALFFIIYGLRKQWWVPGWTYAECREDVKELEIKVQEYIDRTQKRLDVLENLENQRPPPRRRS